MSNDKLDPQLFRQAAQLLTRLHSGYATDADHAAFSRWQAQSDAHRRVGELAQQLRHQFEAVPQGLSSALRHDQDVLKTRRRVVKTISMLAVVGPTAWLASRMPWQVWNAGYRTATGAQRDVQLADGTHLILNTDSALDVVTNASTQKVVLHEGEVMVLRASTGQATHRAIAVQTAEGSVESTGAQFSVRQLSGLTKVAAFIGDVLLSPASGTSSRLKQGQCCSFTRDATAAPQTVNEHDALWTRGLIYADNMRLGDLVAELSRYRSGVLRCADDVAGLRVSGLYQVSNTDATLALLERAYPVHIQSITPYWTVVEARGSGSRAGDADGSPKPVASRHDT
ncbi:FecR domain-containing protein [Paraburkholderia sp.]|uniref:FecR domain-containing protein n=1 Tax=Paraburkholderia sp. TaxID=1926495 RepID=UPI003D6F1696